jgi:hypothetical protein
LPEKQLPFVEVGVKKIVVGNVGGVVVPHGFFGVAGVVVVRRFDITGTGNGFGLILFD